MAPTPPTRFKAGRLAAEQDRLLACVHCGFCLNACPTYTRLGDEADSPRGRLYLMRAVAEGRLPADDAAFATHIDRCLGCRACEPVCPSGVEYGHLLERARATIADTGRTSPLTRLLLTVFSDRLFTQVAMTAGRILRATGLPRILARSLPASWHSARFGMAMLAASKPTPVSQLDTLPAPLPSRTQPQPLPSAPKPPAEGTRGPRVALLLGCVQDGLFARVNAATRRVLQVNGCTIVPVPVQHCCGALHAHGGGLDTAKDLARANLGAFDRANVDIIVANAAGCSAMMKSYGELLVDDPAWANRAQAFASRVRDVNELLVTLGIRQGAPLPIRVTYDAPCHLQHAQGITQAPLQVLAAIPGLQHVPLQKSDECCGGAGIYGLLHPELGGHILEDKLAAVRETRPTAVVTPNPGCAMQIGAGLVMSDDDTPVVHPVELLDESYRRAGYR